MSHILTILLPIFGLIAIGYAAEWGRLLRPATGEGISDFVFTIAIPVLIFRTIAEADFGGVAPWRIWLPYFGASAAMWVLGHVLIRRLFARDARGGLVAGMSSAYGNTVLMGIPLSLAAFGEAGAVPIALILALHLPLMMAVSGTLIERAQRLDGIAGGNTDTAVMLRAVVLNLGRNPIIIGLLAGGVWRLLGMPIVGVPAVLVDRLAAVAATLALVAMGMSLRQHGIRGNIGAGLVVSGLKLVIMPATVFLLARYVIPMPPVWAKVAVVTASCPTGVNAYLVAARFRTGEGIASNAISISSALSIVSVAVWLSIAEAAWE